MNESKQNRSHLTEEEKQNNIKEAESKLVMYVLEAIQKQRGVIAQ